jgi:hypothetical protein
LGLPVYLNIINPLLEFLFFMGIDLVRASELNYFLCKTLGYAPEFE